MADKQLVFTTPSGASSVITTNVTLDAALSTLETRVYEYVDNGDSLTLTSAKDYANSLVSNMANELVINIPIAKTVINYKYKAKFATYDLNITSGQTYSGNIYNNLNLVVALDALTWILKDTDKTLDSGTITVNNDFWILSNGRGTLKKDNNVLKYHATLSLVDISYIDALSVANQVYTNKKITDLQNTLDQTAITSAKNAETRANNYTDVKTNALDAAIQALDVTGCTYETFLNYLARTDAAFDELYDTVDEEYYKQMGWIP